MELKIIPFFLVLTLGTIVFLGLLSIVFIDHFAYHLCPISVMLGSDCPSVGNGLIFVSHHIFGFHYSVLSVIRIDLISSILFTLLVFLFFIFSKRLDKTYFYHSFIGRSYCLFGYYSINLGDRFFRWLALRNKRDIHAPCLGA